MDLKECVSFMIQLFLCKYIAFPFTFMYTIYFIFHYFQQCRYTQCTLFLCLHMEAKEEENNHTNEQNNWPNNPIDVSGSRTNNSSNKE